MKFIIFPRFWTIQQQLTILLVLFLGLGGAAMWLLAELFHNREGAIVATTQTELNRANAQLIEEFQATNSRQIPIAQLEDRL